ncbi:MAG: galactokinase [Chitinophagales bacterium]|nr:galactokinase [Chitinophagales bacterium]
MTAPPDAIRNLVQDNSLFVFSPGRINLIGEFTDYNMGFVLPAAIDKGIYFVLTPRTDNLVQLYSVDFNATYETTIDDLIPSDTSSWPNYILGVVEQFKLAGIDVNGFNAAVAGNIPVGAGLSSSAAVECAVAMSLNEMTHASLQKLKLVQMAQRAENDFVGVRCGIMDQFASMFGKPGQAIKIDCRSLEHEYVPISMDGLRILLLDSNVKHSHGTSEYNVRRNQCEEGVAMIRQHEQEVYYLRDASIAMLDAYIAPFDNTLYRRCKFIVEENERVVQAAEQLKKGDVRAFGKLMFASHAGLQHDYEASCPEIDFLVSSVKHNDAVKGARMMGGGFGGCSINLVQEESVASIIENTAVAYEEAFGKTLTPYVAKVEAGTTILKGY